MSLKHLPSAAKVIANLEAGHAYSCYDEERGGWADMTRRDWINDAGESRTCYRYAVTRKDEVYRGENRIVFEQDFKTAAELEAFMRPLKPSHWTHHVWENGRWR